jgi:hypothetical protein
LLPDILRARIFAIACGYEDADDLDRLRGDPAFKLACGRLPDTGTDLCSQPTTSRWENAPALRDLIRLMGVMVDLYCNSYATPPAAVTLDIDDTVDVVHGHQQLSCFNKNEMSPPGDRWFESISLQRRVMCEPALRRGPRRRLASQAFRFPSWRGLAAAHPATAPPAVSTRNAHRLKRGGDLDSAERCCPVSVERQAG